MAIILKYLMYHSNYFQFFKVTYHFFPRNTALQHEKGENLKLEQCSLLLTSIIREEYRLL